MLHVRQRGGAASVDVAEAASIMGEAAEFEFGNSNFKGEEAGGEEAGTNEGRTQGRKPPPGSAGRCIAAAEPQPRPSSSREARATTTADMPLPALPKQLSEGVVLKQDEEDDRRSSGLHAAALARPHRDGMKLIPPAPLPLDDRNV